MAPIEVFNPLTLPEHLRRESILTAKFQPEGYLEALDRETLWYDAFWADGTVTIIGPPLNNLGMMFRQARFAVDGTPVKLWRMHRYRRHFIAQFRVKTAPKTLSVTMTGWTGESPVSIAKPEVFHGLNTVLYINKNNDLQWIRDHAEWHKKEHGLQGAVIIDNGSTEYTPQQIEEALAPVGLSQVLVMPAPFKFGPMGAKPYRRTEKYLQTALLNVAGLRCLPTAAAVLHCDVDELIVRRGERGVFDAAKASRLGFIQIEGRWAYGAPDSEGPYLHRDHSYAHQPPRKSPPKYCVVPSGLMGGFSRDVHGLERLPLLHSWLHPEFFFLHCRGVSTGWKSSGRLKMPEATVRNPEAEAALSRLS